MSEFINIFRSLMIWLSRPGGHIPVRVIIEFDKPDDLAEMENQLRHDMKAQYKSLFGDLDQPMPRECYGIPFELTVRASGG